MAGEGGGIVALLFTDLVGSTSMYDRLGDERAEELRRAHFAALRQALVSHGGQEVKNLGDGLMVTFSSAVAAVEAAIAMQRTTNGGEVRVGLHAGEPLRDEGDYFGVSVNIAKRLCDVAQPGQIYASDLIRALVSPRMRTGLRPVGALELKGIEEPVNTYEVEWDRVGSPMVLPSLLAEGGDAPFVGRQAELERLLLLWKHATEGTPRIALVAGEPGIGKTRLVQELARRATEGPCVVLAGRSDAELALPLEPFAEALREAATTWSAALQPALCAPELEPLTPTTGAGTALPDTERVALFDAVSRLIGVAEQEAPVLLVLDDLHWADEASLLLLRHLLHARHQRLLVVVTYRDTELSRKHPLSALLADLRREHGVERISLHGLAAESIEAMLGGAAGSPAIVDLAVRIAEETEGNAFYVTEVIRNLVELGHLRQGDDGWEVARPLHDIDVPEGIREVIGRRLSRLSSDCNDLLTVASVVGRRFSARLVADVAEVSLDEALDAIDEALEVRIIAEDRTTLGHFIFSHALVRETLYGELTTVRRLRLHLRVGEALRAVGGPLSEIAHHLLEAGPAGSERAAGEAAVAAVHDARYRLAAFEDAAALSRRALALIGDQEPDLRCDLLTVLGDVTLCIGDAAGFDHLDQALDLGRRLGDPVRIARTVTFAIRAGVSAAGTQHYVEVAHEAIRLLPDDASDIRTRLRAVLALSRMLDPSELPDVLAEALETDDAESIAYAALAVFDDRLAANEPMVAKAALDDAAEVLRDRMDEAELVFDERYFDVAMLVGDRDHAESIADRLKEGSDRLNLPKWGDPLPRAALALLDGRLDDADAWVQRVMNHRGALVYAGPILATIAIERDQCELFLPYLEAQVSENGDAGWQAATALFLVESGRPEEAQTRLEDAVRTVQPNVGWRVTMGVLAEAASALGDANAAAVVREGLEPLRGLMLMATGLCLGAVERPLGMCALTSGDVDAAVALLEAAVERNQAVRAALWAAHSEVELAQALRRRTGPGAAARAERLLRGAASPAAELRLPRLARRAEAARGRAASVYD